MASAAPVCQLIWASPALPSLMHPAESCSFLVGQPVKTSSPISAPGKDAFKRSCVIVSRKLFGLEEAMRIRRQKELRDSVKLRKRQPLRRGKVSEKLLVPDHIARPPYVDSVVLPELSSERQVHDEEGIAGMRAACELAARVLDYAGTLVRPSVTTNEIDKAVHQMIIDAGAYPSPLGYGGFPKSVCTSVNECMCHGIPDSRQLQNGDIINIDVTAYLNGYHGDTSKTFICGNVHEPVNRLVKVTEECLEKAIHICKDGASFKKIGKRISNSNEWWHLDKLESRFKDIVDDCMGNGIGITICIGPDPNGLSEHAEKHGFGVVERFVGHGVGKVFHSQPLIYHHRNDEPGRMIEGETFTIEPILTMGSIECITWDDGWTTVTADGGRAAQFEHTILITRTGAEILTKC